MNVRSSLREILHFGRPAEVCQFEWGYWDETVERWRKEGMTAAQPWDAAGISYYHRVPAETRFYPPFTTEVIEETAHTRIIRDEMGVIKEESKDGTAFPRYLKHPVENMRDFEAIKERLNPDSSPFPAGLEAAGAGACGTQQCPGDGWNRDQFFWMAPRPDGGHESAVRLL